MTQKIPEFENIIEKAHQAQREHKLDLSLEEDLSIAIMNLVSIEEHLYFTGIKTDKPDYFTLIDEVRTVRKDLLARMIDTREGETWCIAKHLLAATMRLIEVGTKYMHEGKKEDAQHIFQLGSKIYNLFWAIRLKLINKSNTRKINDTQLDVHDTSLNNKWSYEDIVKKLVNCCNE